MRMRMLMLGCVLAMAPGCAQREQAAGNARHRRFKSRRCQIRYVARVSAIPAHSRVLRLWIPLPRSNKHQRITGLTVRSPYRHALHRDSQYGNRFVFFEVPDPPADVRVEVRFMAQRFENCETFGRHADRSLLKRFLQADTLVPLSEEIRSLALTVVRGETSVTGRARALYEHVLSQMTYDKSGQGWGRGDFDHACKVKRGNCTDFHSYFIGLCRNIGIPAYFEIGLSLPGRPVAGQAPGYHCWAYFWDGTRWVPVDISEADKHPDKANYFFGNLDENRVAFCIGRDLLLDPRQRGEPLNFFIRPYAEVDGKPHAEVQKQTFYSNAPARNP